MTQDVLARERALEEALAGLRSVVVAMSGGVDSAYLAVKAHLVLGEKALAVTAESASLAEVERADAREVARLFGLRHRFVPTGEVLDPAYVRNDGLRCYHCKSELFRTLVPLARSLGFAHVAYGLIVDDRDDFRPGHRAAAEAGVLSPLADAGLTKADVRALSRRIGLPTWDKPASPCLSSRIPYGTPVTDEALRQVERAEAGLRALGFRELRVRHLGGAARVEIGASEMARLEDAQTEASVRAAVLAAGYGDVAIDRRGYRRGSLNEVLRVLPVASV